MPRLYCEEHGREDDARIIGRQEHYRQEDESVLVVRGKLISGPWCCDRCNATLRKGAIAWLFSAYPRWIAEGLTDYDFGQERQYFAMGKYDKATVYGADWPDDSIRHRRPARPGGQKKSPPLCALDIIAKK